MDICAQALVTCGLFSVPDVCLIDEQSKANPMGCVRKRRKMIHGRTDPHRNNRLRSKHFIQPVLICHEPTAMARVPHPFDVTVG